MHLFKQLFSATCLAPFLLAATPGRAEPAGDKIVFAPAPAWAETSADMEVPPNARGTVFFRRQDTQTHLDKKGQTIFSAALVRLLDPNALQIGNVAISWNPAAGKPVIHALKVHREGTVRDVLKTIQFEVIQRENQLDAAVLNGNLTATLRIPDLRVGDDLEISYSIPSQDPTLASDSYGLLFLADNPSPGRFGLRLTWDAGQNPKIRASKDFEGQLKISGNAAVLSADMPQPLNPPRNAPPRYSWQRAFEFSDFADWQAVSSRLWPLFDKAAMLSAKSEIRQEAQGIGQAHPDQAGRAAAALDLVQRQIRYVYVGFNGGNLTPVSADETWQRRYGDCKGKTVLLLALLKELGIPAEAVLASNSGNDDGLNEHLPSPGAFDHVLVRAQVDGKTLWLDGTLPPVIPASAAPAFPYRWVLPVSQAGQPLEAIAWKPANRPDLLTLYEIDARAGLKEPAKIRQTIIARGPGAISDYYQLTPLTDAQLLSAFRQQLEGGSDWDVLESATWRFDEKNQASILEFKGTGQVDWEGSDRMRNLVLPGGGFNPPDRRQRTSDQDQSAPYYTKPGFDCRVTTVRLPAETKVSEWSFGNSFDTTMFGSTYRRSFERRDGAITMIRSDRTFQTEIDGKMAAADNLRLAKFDNSMAQIFYEKGSIDVPRKDPRLPTTYDNDWVANDTACLSQIDRTKITP